MALQSPFDAYPPCEVCGLDTDECICPECPTCGDVGNPDCYKNHLIKKTVAQEIEYQKFVVKDLYAQWQEAKQVLDYLEEQANRQGD